MTIKNLMKMKNISQYRLSKNCNIPYATINDICNGKTQIEKCSAITIYRIAKELGVSMESLIEPYIEVRGNFEIFKSNICHRLKELGDIDFLIELLESDSIGKYYRKEWYPESLYLLAMLDYVSRENDIPYCTQYDEIRRIKLKETLFPAGILVAFRVTKDESIKKKSIEDSIPEFIRFNIVENDVRNVV